MEELKRLGELVCRIDRYSSELVKNLARTDLKCEADEFGYSYQHWEQTGRWQKYTDLETGFNSVSKPIKTVEAITETNAGETEKNANTRNVVVFSPDTGTGKVCEFCAKRFETTRKVKRFCTDKCKIDFNNLKRKNENNNA